MIRKVRQPFKNKSKDIQTSPTTFQSMSNKSESISKQSPKMIQKVWQPLKQVQ